MARVMARRRKYIDHQTSCFSTDGENSPLPGRLLVMRVHGIHQLVSAEQWPGSQPRPCQPPWLWSVPLASRLGQSQLRSSMPLPHTYCCIIVFLPSSPPFFISTLSSFATSFFVEYTGTYELMLAGCVSVHMSGARYVCVYM